MEIDFVSVKVSIECRAIGIMHADRSLALHTSAQAMTIDSKQDEFDKTEPATATPLLTLDREQQKILRHFTWLLNRGYYCCCNAVPCHRHSD